MEGRRDGERGMFVLFLVQYAVHKSLALQILQFLFIFFLLLNGYIAVFFFIKILWTDYGTPCVLSATKNANSKTQWCNRHKNQLFKYKYRFHTGGK